MVMLFLLALGFPAVLGGVPAPDDKDCVAIGVYDRGTREFRVSSSGVLVSPRLVLTAGYATQDMGARERLSVFLGADVGKAGQVVGVARTVDHPDQGRGPSGGVGGGSLVLLVLDEDVSPDVARPRPFASSAAVDAAQVLRVVGFGATDSFGSTGVGVRRQADIPIVVSDGGRDARARTRYGCVAGEMVAISPSGHDTSNGDGGGPAYIEAEGEWLLAAITSRTVSNATRLSGDGGIYVRLDKYQDWVRQHAPTVSAPLAKKSTAKTHKANTRTVEPRPSTKGAGAGGIAMAPRKTSPAPMVPAEPAPTELNPTQPPPFVVPTPGVKGQAGPVAPTARSIHESAIYNDHAQVHVQAQFVRGRIASGLNTSQFRDCVAVGDAEGRFFATGTLVAPQVVVTAGHAYDEDIGQIMIGDDFRSVPSAIARIKVVKKIRKDWKVNDDPNLPRFVNDLTLLVLDRPVLPAEAEPRAIATESIIAAAKLAVVAGFGSTGDMTIPGAGSGPKRSVQIPIATSDCNRNVDGVTDQQAFGCAAGMELVAADPLRRKDSCEGDSGGPLYVQHDGKYFVAGATSRSTRRNRVDIGENGLPLVCGTGGIYVRLDKYRDWIIEVARENGVAEPTKVVE